MQLTKQRPLVLLAFVLACVLGFGLVAGCAAPNAQENPAEKNRDYMMKANNAMIELNKELDEFSTAVASGDVVTMERYLSAASKDIESFKALAATDATKDIHSEYSAGCDDLREALSSYVELYRNADGVDTAVFDERLSSIQERYNAGLAHLKKGDELVTQLQGATPDKGEASDAEGGKVASEGSDSESEGAEEQTSGEGPESSSAGN